jgi:zinc transport system ATP-binding protein
MSDLVVDIKDLWVSLTHGYILREVSLQISRGVFLGLIGPNGGGKTTLLRVILGLIKPDRGQVRVFDRPADHTENRGLIGYVPQRAFADLTYPVSAFDVVMMGRYAKIGFWKKPSDEDRRQVLEKLEAVQMNHLRERPIGHLSGGEQQRVFIARALACDPQMLLLDEPTAGVDSRAQGSFYELLGRLKRELSLTIVLVSHDIGVIPYHTDEIACLNQKLHLHGKCPDVMDSGTLERVYGCEVEILVHGKIPHRVIGEHDD